jgi:riboflavin kinase / FMN adenylyltransferase
MFDGVHLGHRAVLEAAIVSARRTHGVAAALTFDPHPSRLFNPDQAVPLIQPVATKVNRMLMAGIGAVITEPFTPKFAAIEAADFVAHLKRELPTLAAIYVGENWRYGKGRKGDLASLQQSAAAAGLRVFSAPRVNFDSEPISSTRIRRALSEGELELVNALLGYTYRSHGAVVSGRRLGRQLGFPTLNLVWDPECPPKFGVYAVRVSQPGEATIWEGVANYGVRPTVESGDAVRPQLEVHLFDPPSFGPDAMLEVDWCAFIRSEKRFGSVDELRDQITLDRGSARQWFDQLG